MLVKQSCLKGNNEMLDQGSELPVIIKPGRTHGRRKTLSVEERRERERERGGGLTFVACYFHPRQNLRLQ